MERLTLDEAIKHAKEVADMNYNDAEKFDSNDSVENYMKGNCMKCAEQHEKLAEWLEELKSYKEAEKQGLLVKLPCKVGDTVWDNDFGYPESYEIKAFSYGYCDSYVEPNIEDEIIFYYENYNGSITGAFPMSELGKTVFLTREEAAKKLERRSEKYMKRIAKFEKVSLEEFMKDWCDTFDLDPSDADTKREVEDIYNSIKLPKRATAGSAGYDFFAPLELNMNPGVTIKVPTGIRCKIDEGWVLKCYPRSGLGFKYRLQLDNTVGIIDSDYYDSDNEGHIFIKITNDSKRSWKNLSVHRGDGFAQGIFVEYGITIDDEAAGVRNGGFGSTTENK